MSNKCGFESEKRKKRRMNPMISLCMGKIKEKKMFIFL